MGVLAHITQIRWHCSPLAGVVLVAPLVPSHRSDVNLLGHRNGNYRGVAYGVTTYL